MLIRYTASHLDPRMDTKAKIPTELAAIAAGCCIGAGLLLLSVALGAMLLPRGVPYPDKVVQTLYKDPSVQPLMICEGISALLLGVTSLVAGLMVFARAKSAGFMLRVTLVLAALYVIADIVIQGWLVVPALRRLAPSLKPPQATMYDPRLRPWLPIGLGLVVLAVLCGIGLTLRRPHVRTMLAANRTAV